MSTVLILHKIKSGGIFISAVYVIGDTELSVTSRFSFTPAPLEIMGLLYADTRQSSPIKIENTIAYPSFIWYNILKLI